MPSYTPDKLTPVPTYAWPGAKVTSAPPWSDAPYVPAGHRSRSLQSYYELAMQKEEPTAVAGTRWPTLPGISVAWLAAEPYIPPPVHHYDSRPEPRSHRRPARSSGLWAISAAVFVAAVGVAAAETQLPPHEQAVANELVGTLSLATGLVAILRPWRTR
jgi:hypothetical protein